MGNAFFVPIAEVMNLERAVAELQEMNYDVAATVLDETAEMLPLFGRRPRQALVFGEEATGVTASCVAACDRQVTLPMANGVDSLNVAVASGVFLYEITHRAPSEESIGRAPNPAAQQNRLP